MLGCGLLPFSLFSDPIVLHQKIIIFHQTQFRLLEYLKHFFCWKKCRTFEFKSKLVAVHLNDSFATIFNCFTILYLHYIDIAMRKANITRVG